MKKKMVKALLVGVAAMAMVVNGVGCTPKEEKSPVQSEAVKEDPNETAVKELKKYIPKVDRLKVVQNAKNLDMTKAVTGLVDEKQKDKVASVKVDDSKLDETKPGTYEVTVTVTLKDDNSKTTPDSTKAPAKEDAGKTEDNTRKAEETTKDTTAKDDTSAADKDTPVKEDTTKPETLDKEDTGKTEDSKGETQDKPGTDADSKEDTSKEDNTISGTVDVEIVDKDKVEDLTGKGDVVITDDNKVVESDKPAEDKKEDDKDKDKDKKPDNDKKPETDENSKPSKEEKPDNNSQSTNKPAGGSSNNSNNNQQSHTHSWVQQYTTVYHEEVGHSEQVWVVDAQAWDEPVYEGHYICNKCGADLGTGDPTAHSIECRSGYHTENVQVGTTHHDEVGHYESKWVVDSQAWTETVPNGYSCSGCGATK